MEIRIIFGTESGNAELTAYEIEEALSDRFETSVENMADVDVDAIDKDAFYFVVSSTYGEGELPYTAKPFYEALTQSRPDLTGLRYALFGRGDTAYLKTYSHGCEILDELLSELGAQRVGEIARHDASDWSIPDEFAADWADGIVELIGVRQTV
ncbi:flavodoxin domain-containing protein [Microbacterium aurum]